MKKKFRVNKDIPQLKFGTGSIAKPSRVFELADAGPVDHKFTCTMIHPKKRHRLVSTEYSVVVDCPSEYIDLTKRPKRKKKQ